MEVKVIKNNLLIEYVEHNQMDMGIAIKLFDKYKDCNILEYKIQFVLNVNLLQTTDFGWLNHKQIQSLTITLQ
jgi:hypothetical protein